MKLGVQKTKTKTQFLDVENKEERYKRLGLLIPNSVPQPPDKKRGFLQLKSKLKDAAFDVVIEDVSSQLLRPFLLAIAATFALYLPSSTPSGLALFFTALAAPFAISFALKFSFKLSKHIVKKCAVIIEKEVIKNALLETSGALKKAGYVICENASFIILRKVEEKIKKPEQPLSLALEQPWSRFNNPPMLLHKPTGTPSRVLIEEIEPVAKERCIITR